MSFFATLVINVNGDPYCFDLNLDCENREGTIRINTAVWMASINEAVDCRATDPDSSLDSTHSETYHKCLITVDWHEKRRLQQACDGKSTCTVQATIPETLLCYDLDFEEVFYACVPKGKTG